MKPQSHCYGGRHQEMTLEITSYDIATGKVKGVAHGVVAHDHGYMQNDAEQTQGDFVFNDFAFEATLDPKGTTPSFSDDASQNEIDFTHTMAYTLPDTSHGSVTLYIGLQASKQSDTYGTDGKAYVAVRTVAKHPYFSMSNVDYTRDDVYSIQKISS